MESDKKGQKAPVYAVNCLAYEMISRTLLKIYHRNKKVLLRERKRHTDRGVSSTPPEVEVGTVGGLKQDKDTALLLVRVYCIKHVRLVGVLLSNCVADLCLLNI